MSLSLESPANPPRRRRGQPEQRSRRPEPGDQQPNLIQFLGDEKAVRYFGRSWALRVDVLAQIQTESRSLYSIAAEYRVSRQYVSRLASEARAIFGASPP